MLLSSLAITMAQERRNATSNLERVPAFIARHLHGLSEPRYLRSEARQPSIFGERDCAETDVPGADPHSRTLARALRMTEFEHHQSKADEPESLTRSGRRQRCAVLSLHPNLAQQDRT